MVFKSPRYIKRGSFAFGFALSVCFPFLQPNGLHEISFLLDFVIGRVALFVFYLGGATYLFTVSLKKIAVSDVIIPFVLFGNLGSSAGLIVGALHQIASGNVNGWRFFWFGLIGVVALLILRRWLMLGETP